ncbi:MAG: hypothetical protein DMD96_23050 [Candidatus Rokuibacteriota bacterium]|nr:MAG: hypothetical protein DMD96_23050 [Candidatus Rokubacteria bacterium]
MGRTRPRRLAHLAQRGEVVGNDRDPIADRARHGLGDKGCLAARCDVAERPRQRSANEVTVGIQALDSQTHVGHPVRRVIEDAPLDPGDHTVRRRRPADSKPALGLLFAGLSRLSPRRRRQQDEPEPERQRACRHRHHGRIRERHGRPPFRGSVDRVKVNVTLLGGGFGRKSKPDYVVEAALLSRAISAPVKVTWTREDEIHHDYYHTVTAQHLEAALDPRGRARRPHRDIAGTVAAGASDPSGEDHRR